MIAYINYHNFIKQEGFMNTQTNKKNLPLIILAVIAAVQFIYILTGSSGGDFAKREYGGDVVAKVNGDEIREEEVRERLDFITGGKGASIDFNNIDEKGLEALAKEVFVQRLVYDEAIKAGVHNDKDTQNRVASIVSTIYKEKYLEGIAKEQINEENIKKTYDELVAKAKNSKQFKVRHILFKDEAAAKSAREKITSGSASFEDVARLDSIDKQSATRGGDLGFIFPEEYVPEFAAAVKQTSRGQISQPVKSEFGWHLIKVEDSKPAEIIEFDQAKPRIEKQLGADAVRKHVEEISKDLEIEVMKREAKSEEKNEDKAEEKK
jgi:peptidyl-prolyl cis-trans isomerase C